MSVAPFFPQDWVKVEDEAVFFGYFCALDIPAKEE